MDDHHIKISQRNLTILTKTIGLKQEEGWQGVLTRDHAPGAIDNGEIFRKVSEEEGDLHKIGDTGIILGSVDLKFLGRKEEYGYFVEWFDEPKKATFIIGSKIDRAMFRNFYKCDRCSHQWEDIWSATCEDDCPQCGARHMSPYKSEDV